MNKLIAIAGKRSQIHLTDVYSSEILFMALNELDSLMSLILEDRWNVTHVAGIIQDATPTFKAIFQEFIGHELTASNVVRYRKEIMTQIRTIRHDLRLNDDVLQATMARPDFWATISDNSEVAIGIITLTGKVVYANPRTYLILGYTRDEFIRRNIMTFLDPENKKKLLRQLHL